MSNAKREGSHFYGCPLFLHFKCFGYTDLQIEDRTVRVTVCNIGARAGAEVVQLYLRAPQQGLHRPVRELKGFQKVQLLPGERKAVCFVLDERSFAVWQDGWVIPGGRYTVEVGGLSAQLEVEGGQLPAPAWQQGSWYERCQGKPSQAEWERMLGRAYTAPTLAKGRFTMDNTVEEMRIFSRALAECIRKY